MALRTVPPIARGMLDALRRPDVERREILASVGTARALCAGPTVGATVRSKVRSAIEMTMVRRLSRPIPEVSAAKLSNLRR